MPSALLRAFVSLLHPKMLLLMFWPMVIAVFLWIGLAVAFWAQAAQWVDLQFRSTDTVQWMITIWPLALVATHLAWIVLAIAMVPLILVTAVLIIGVFSMPAMVAHVSAYGYPALARREGGTFAGSIWNAAVAVAVFVLLAAVTLPLWLVPLFWPLLPVLLFAYLNQRVFRYDALAEHASAEEIGTIVRRHRGELFGLGVVVALFGHVPILGFFVPVYGGLAFIHFCLDKLQALRDAPIEGTAIPGN
jgi:CysZ protein